MEFGAFSGNLVLKPMGTYDLEERDELFASHMDSNPSSLDYERCMCAGDRSLVTMVSERDEVD